MINNKLPPGNSNSVCKFFTAKENKNISSGECCLSTTTCLYTITSMEVKGNYDRQTDQLTNRQTYRQGHREVSHQTTVLEGVYY